jgi:hypothetical protein
MEFHSFFVVLFWVGGYSGGALEAEKIGEHFAPVLGVRAVE